MTHKKWCIDSKKVWEVERSRFEALYPNHCTMCNGVGGKIYSYDPSAAGVSLSAGCMYDVEFCKYCVEQGRCPQCDGKLVDDECRCMHCGWDEENLPVNPSVEFECYCWE